MQIQYTKKFNPGRFELGTTLGLFTWSGVPRSSGVGFFCLHALGHTKQKKLTPLDRGPPLHVNRPLDTIERFHSRGQHLCKFIGTKESVYIRKEFNSHRTGLGHKHGRRFIVLGHKYGRHDVK